MHKIRITQQILLLVAFIFLSGCGGSPSVQVNELSSDTVSYDEIIHINNCGGKADSEQTASHSFATTIEGGVELSATYQSIVEGGVSAKYSQYRNVSKSQRLIAPPATNMEFTLRWSEDVHAGNVSVNGATGNYKVHVPVAVEQVSSQDLGCGSSNSQTTTNVVEVAHKKPTSASSFYKGGTNYTFSPSAIVDGKSDELPCPKGVENGNSYWLLQDHKTGWVQIDLQQNYAITKVRWLNTHNGSCGDRATTLFHIAISDSGFFTGEEIIIFNGSMEFSKTPQFQEFSLPESISARYVRFYIDDYYNWGGGLNELEIYAFAIR